MKHLPAVLSLLYESQFASRAVDISLDSSVNVTEAMLLADTNSKREPPDGLHKEPIIHHGTERIVFAGPNTWRVEETGGGQDGMVVRGCNAWGTWLREPNRNILSWPHPPREAHKRDALPNPQMEVMFPFRLLPGMRLVDVQSSTYEGWPSFKLELHTVFEDWSLFHWGADAHSLEVEATNGVVLQEVSYRDGRAFKKRWMTHLAVNVALSPSLFRAPAR